MYPRFGGLNLGVTKEYDAAWAEFNKTLGAIFAALKFGLHHYFYVFTDNFAVLIIRNTCFGSDVSPNSTATSMPGLKVSFSFTFNMGIKPASAENRTFFIVNVSYAQS